MNSSVSRFVGSLSTCLYTPDTSAVGNDER
jgi:hypothetical protein